ncbi:Uncharacterized protein FWK35_00039251 [Aphis craccivora]|uniref:Uncharacterized protein n=1 Tax=Aphis craccivora TaxID=307492 RepID=A0A6G0Y722_APHCR|nr:Uncharacterized protein FWK35_00039251 [Aphis craccivora]
MGLEWRSSQAIGSIHSKVRKICGSRNHQFPELSTDCVIRFPTWSNSTGSGDLIHVSSRRREVVSCV